MIESSSANVEISKESWSSFDDLNFMKPSHKNFYKGHESFTRNKNFPRIFTNPDSVIYLSIDVN